jgi:hypothetical protein
MEHCTKDHPMILDLVEEVVGLRVNVGIREFEGAH